MENFASLRVDHAVHMECQSQKGKESRRTTHYRWNQEAKTFLVVASLDPGNWKHGRRLTSPQFTEKPRWSVRVPWKAARCLPDLYPRHHDFFWEVCSTRSQSNSSRGEWALPWLKLENTTGFSALGVLWRSSGGVACSPTPRFIAARQKLRLSLEA